MGKSKLESENLNANTSQEADAGQEALRMIRTSTNDWVVSGFEYENDSGYVGFVAQ